MNLRSKIVTSCMVAAIFSLGASSSWATITCSTAIGTGSNVATLAVAANFVAATTALVQNCQTAGTCNDTKFYICQDNTVNLTTALLADYTSHTPNAFVTYSYFFAADTTPSSSSFTGKNGIGTAWSYAKGIPVFFGYTSAIHNVGNLVTGLTGTVATSDDDNDLSTSPINTSAAGYIAVAGTGAPYGVKSHAIINSMMSLPLGGNLPDTIPSYVVNPLYVNINNTFSAVGNTPTSTVKSGFVSKGQLCDGIGKYAYVEFKNSAYLLDQQALRLNSNVAAGMLDSYISSMKTAGTWATFLDSMCYMTP